MLPKNLDKRLLELERRRLPAEPMTIIVRPMADGVCVEETLVRVPPRRRCALSG